MVKEERSLRTRQWPVRSGVLRGALSENLLFPTTPSPLAQPRPDRVTESTACLLTEDPTESRETFRPAVRRAFKMPTLVNSSRTALARRQLTLPVSVSSPATAVS